MAGKLKPPESVGRPGHRYRIEEPLGSGGMGAVFKGVHVELGRPVAVKLLRPAPGTELDGSRLARFEREARAAGALGHPHIIAVTDFQTDPSEQPFIVMELLQGESLDQALENHIQLPVERVVRIFVQVLSALDAAHATGIVHRDIKPGNIFLCDSATGGDLVKVLDFGVAKLTQSNEPGLTRTGMVVGTLRYMAPEQGHRRSHRPPRRSLRGGGMHAPLLSPGACRSSPGTPSSW